MNATLRATRAEQFHLRCLRALTVEPPNQHCNRTRIVPQTMTTALNDVQLCAAMGFCQRSRVALWHQFVFVAVHQEQRSRRKTSRGFARPEPS